QVPVACKSCPCGYIFISRKLLHAKRAERSPPITGNTYRDGKKGALVLSLCFLEAKDRVFYFSLLIVTFFSSTEKQEKEVDMYANLSDEKAFVFSVALAEINRKIINQRLIL
ncbi:CE087 protein, partial [Chroicocephalus maculipennis]|nr:CE087 protein [Chroicocephalus maculipennis]